MKKKSIAKTTTAEANTANDNNLASTPFVINIKNTTDEKIYGVKLFNYEHEKQNKLQYNYKGIDDSNYNDLLRQHNNIKAGQMDIAITYIIAYCDYNKFKRKQLDSPYKIIYKDYNGGCVSFMIVPTIDPYQMQPDIAVNKKVFEFSNQLQIEFEYLMPETEITIHLYPKSS